MHSHTSTKSRTAEIILVAFAAAQHIADGFEAVDVAIQRLASSRVVGDAVRLLLADMIRR